tara:strand:- start:999 stop:1457 length:459 start_codon:yes stop_codon:yes gene_type:complete
LTQLQGVPSGDDCRLVWQAAGLSGVRACALLGIGCRALLGVVGWLPTPAWGRCPQTSRCSRIVCVALSERDCRALLGWLQGYRGLEAVPKSSLKALLSPPVGAFGVSLFNCFSLKCESHEKEDMSMVYFFFIYMFDFMILFCDGVGRDVDVF